MLLALPAQPIIQTGQWVWQTLWQIMMSQLAPSKPTGDYQRPDSTFLDAIGTEQYPAATGRYRLYVGLSCPWAHRTLLVRSLKGLEKTVDVVVLRASVAAGGWAFDPAHEGCTTLAQFYRHAHPNYRGRTTVPVLWDKQTGAIVNNESAEIIKLLNSTLNEFAENPNLDLSPEALRPDIDRWNDEIYTTLNNGVYRCGFAQSQAAYNEAVTTLFATLNKLDIHLAQQRYLCGAQLTLADVRLFPTLIRFDAVYHGLFRCDRRRIVDYPNLWGYLRDLYQHPGIAQTCDLAQMRQDYYQTLFPINPGGIVPIGPDLATLQQPTERDRLV
ncbi:MAG: glutathione S-transferase family protein [Spirulina sp. SIO3F2]|nr:glutathione S-transferase family protein [Spirulina sp. SIO3F2]